MPPRCVVCDRYNRAFDGRPALRRMTDPSYPPARAVASRVHAHLATQTLVARERGEAGLAPEADVDAVEAIIDAAFWASLRREEGYMPTISLAFLPPDRAFRPLVFEPRLPLAADALARLAPAVKRPGIHLGVWSEVPGKDGLRVWGTTRMLPPLCFVLEVIAPGLLVVKYPHGTSGKFVNIVVLEGDQVKVVDERGASVPDCPGIEAIVTTLLGFDSTASWAGPINVFVRLAVSMRTHGRGGALLVVPADSDEWRQSIVQPLRYSVQPPFTEIADLMREPEAERAGRAWQEALDQAIEAVAGLTAVDGATIMNDRYEVLAFAAKIASRRGERPSGAGDRHRAGRRDAGVDAPSLAARRDASPFSRAIRLRPARRVGPGRLAGRALHDLPMVAVRRHGARAPRRSAAAITESGNWIIG